MIILLSPAKSLDLNTKLPYPNYSEPQFLKHSKTLISHLKKLSIPKISTLMGISEKLATLNQERFQNFKLPFNTQNARPAIYTFNGDVYDGLQAFRLTQKQIQFAQKHLRILSGLYGILKPLDLIQPYRLEMGTDLRKANLKPLPTSLYTFWENILTPAIKQELSKQQTVINLASQEYFKVLKLSSTVITPIFKDKKNGVYKIISFYAKKARGLMARFIIENNIKNIEEIQQFKENGYYFNPENSNSKEWYFYRDCNTH